jgi:NitT/TauT family transport system permease protein
VLFPQVVPALLAAARYGFALAWQMTAIVELFGNTNGIGFRIAQAYNTSRYRGSGAMQDVLAWTLVFMLVMLVIEYLVFKPIDNHAARWRAKAEL